MALAQTASLFGRNLSNSVGITLIRCKHYNPKFKWLRKKKYVHDAEFQRRADSKFDTEEWLRKSGALHLRRSHEIPLVIDSSFNVIEPYVPEKGDGQYTTLAEKVKSAINLKEKTKSFGKQTMHVRRIRKYIANFDENAFAQQGLDIYKKAHAALASNDMDELEKYTTLWGINAMLYNMKNKTLHWKYIESLDPPKTVHVRAGELAGNKNMLAQVTVRIHSKQMLAIYDRFGRLMYGSDILAKDVIEYPVFEINLSNPNGTFKLHHKIIPEWTEQRYSYSRTSLIPKEEADVENDMEEHKLVAIAEDEEEKAVQK